MEKLITKASGEKELFSTQKFQRSLHKAGADPATIERITNEVLNNPDLTSTHEIYQYAFSQLKLQTPAIAARYSIKTAISELGPSGYPFEKFVAEILKQDGYETLLNQVVQGFCVAHELDIVLKKEGRHIMVECKFHTPHLKTNVKVPLYIKARFDDLEKKNKKNPREHAIHEAWVVTNTKFTSEAIAYGECVGITMLGWGYPEKNNLAQRIDRLGLHPITALTSLSRKQKAILIQEGLVLCKDTAARRELLKKAGLSDQKIKLVLEEADQICALGEIDRQRELI